MTRAARIGMAFVAVAVVGVGSLVKGGDPPKPPASPFAHGAGVTAAMKEVSWLEGTWDVTMAYFAPDGRSFTSKTESVIEPMLGGSFLQERITVPAGPGLDNAMVGIRSFDRFRNVYRVVWCDSVITLADVYEGVAFEGGFRVDNVKTNTPGVFAGRESYMRITQKPGATKDAFTLLWEGTSDKGQTWSRAAEYTYARKK